MDEVLQKNEELINLIEFPFCKQNFHFNSKQEDLCLEENCETYKALLCPICFEKHNKNHKRFNIKVLLEFIYENLYQESIKWNEYKEQSELFGEINLALEKIQKKIDELNKIKEEIISLQSNLEEILKENQNKYLKIYDDLKQKVLEKKDFLDNIYDILNYVVLKDDIIYFMENNENFYLIENEIKEKIKESMSMLSINTKIHNHPQILIHKDPKEDFVFDPENKGKDMKIQDSNIVFKTNKSGYQQCFAFITPHPNKTAKIKFLIGRCNWIALGICKFQFIKKNNYSFNYTTDRFQRGYYLISHNGYSWSDSDDDDHSKLTSFKFNTNDQIEVNYDLNSKNVIFTKNADETKLLSFDPPINDTFVFCVVMHYIDDNIKII